MGSARGAVAAGSAPRGAVAARSTDVVGEFVAPSPTPDVDAPIRSWPPAGHGPDYGPSPAWVHANGLRYRRAGSGRLQAWGKVANRNGKGWRETWSFAKDPDEQLSPAAQATRDRKRERIYAARAAAPKIKVAPLPFKTTTEDRIRIKLRDKARAQFRAEGDLPNTLVTLPGVQSLAIATRYIDGGRDRFIEFVQYAVLEHNQDAQRWFAVYADLTEYERGIVNFDDVCAASGVKPSKLMAATISAAMEAGRDVGNFVAALSHPKVVQAMVDSALKQDSEIGLKDRHAFLQGMGMLPVPRGTTINLSASATAQAAAAAHEPSVPSFAQDLGTIAAAHRSAQPALSLPAGGPADPALAGFGLPVVDAVAVPVTDESES